MPLPPPPDLFAVLDVLIAGAQSALGDHFTGAYLQGSFALGDWDIHSDVDFIIVTREDLSSGEVSSLQTLHSRIFAMDVDWAHHLEGSYFPEGALRRSSPHPEPLWYLDNMASILVPSTHDNTLVVRWVLRERGIPLAGPPIPSLLDPVEPDDLRREVGSLMKDWGADILTGRWQMDNRWAQSFTVLSYCRMLQTLQTGQVHSKLTAARWAIQNLDRRWTPLIQLAWDDRPDPSLKVHQPADPNRVELTYEFIRDALGRVTVR